MKISKTFFKILCAFTAIYITLFFTKMEPSLASSGSSNPRPGLSRATEAKFVRGKEEGVPAEATAQTLDKVKETHASTTTTEKKLDRQENDAPDKDRSAALNVSALFNVCHTTNNSNLVIMSVITAPANFEKRQKIRSTWGSVKRHYGIEIITAFFIGAVEDAALQEAIVVEARTHRDIVQDNSYTDAYRNLTSKSLSILRWANSSCPNALRVIKVDDDTLVNPYNVISLLRSASNSTAKKLICVITDGSKPYRTKDHKWYVSVEEYNGTTFPPYCQGFGYMIPSGTIGKLLEASTRIASLPMEDVYITGILREFVGMQQVNLGKSLATTCGELMKPFVEKLSHRPKLLLMGHATSLLQYDVFWQFVTENRRPR